MANETWIPTRSMAVKPLQHVDADRHDPPTVVGFDFDAVNGANTAWMELAQTLGIPVTLRQQ
jgi:hypothetical protein